MPDSRFPPIAITLLLIACLCIYGIILDPGATFAGMDFLNLNFPRAMLTRDALAEGVLPLWNWYEWGGAPLLAALQGAVLYPPTWLALALPLPYGLQVFIFCHLFVAGCGAFLLGRRIFRLPVPESIFCGIVYMGSSFFPGRIEQFQIIAVNCLLPWLILTIWMCYRLPRTLWLLSLVWALTLVAGHPQYAVFNLLAALAAVVLFKRRKWYQYNRRALLRILAGLAVGTCLASMQLLPTWELGQLSERIWPYPQPTLPELNWKHLPALLIPRYYELLTGETGRLFGFTELGLYAGILALPLALLALVKTLKSKSENGRTIQKAALIWLVAMIFALGTQGIIAPLVFEYLPFFKQTRGAARSLNVAALMLALLSGCGLAAARVYLAARTTWHVRLVWIICAVTCLDLAFAHYSSLKSVLVPVEVLAASPLAPHQLKQITSGGNLYRFMANDSDLYLNNSPTAVAERQVRLQPNMSSLQQIPLMDGYEEGLLPTRAYANAQRRFNRNLRSDSPDAALLAFMGSSAMLTEYPLSPYRDVWKAIADPFPRSQIVPSIIPGRTAEYTYWDSAYPTAPCLDLDRLVLPAEKAAFLTACSSAFPLENQVREITGNEPALHPFTKITPENYTESASSFSFNADSKSWNRLTFALTRETTSVAILIKPYPGWKLAENKVKAGTIKHLCSLFYIGELASGYGDQSRVELIFSPFSVRLGLFVTLLSFLIVFQLLCNNWGRRILNFKSGYIKS